MSQHTVDATDTDVELFSFHWLVYEIVRSEGCHNKNSIISKSTNI